jgi:Flp pilus assembly protein TadD
MRHPSLLVIAALVASFAGIGAVYADELTEARKLLRAGDREAALKQVDVALAKKPGDQDLRFFKGVILAEDGRTAEALEVYQRLAQDYPELPEAHNNLAVLYAARGDLERARQSLDMAIRTNPGYATAQENLGDVYVQLAVRAYERAGQLDPNNRAAARKLTASRELLQRPKPRVPAAETAPAAKP